MRALVEDEGVRLIGELGEEQKIVASKAVAVVPVLRLVHVAAGESHVVELLLVGFVFPDGRLDSAEPECLHRSFGASGGVPWL